MASRHCSFKTGKAGKGGAHAAYISGVGKYADRSDVVSVIDRNLPGWAADGTAFFAAADAFERKNGRTYSEVEFAIPRSVADPVSFADEFARRLLGKRHPFRLAVHDKPASDGGRNVHGHLMFSERRLDGVERDQVRFFSRANKQQPELGGAAKDRIWNDRKQVQFVRDLYQDHARRHGVELDMRSNAAQGLGEAEPKLGPVHQRSELNAQRKVRQAQVVEVRAGRDKRMAIAGQETGLEALQTVRTVKSSSEPRKAVTGPGNGEESGFSVSNPLHKALEARRRMALGGKSMAVDAAQDVAPSAMASAKSPQALLAQLKARLLDLVGRMVDLRESPVRQVSGTVIAANERWAAMHAGRETQLVDRELWPVEEGRAYSLKDGPNGRQIELRPVNSNTASTLEYVYGKQVGELARQWAERDKALVQSLTKDRGGPSL